MTDHAPTPWSIRQSDGVMDNAAKFETGSKVLIYSETDCEHHPIADCSCNHSCRMSDEQEDNAAFIVKAVNAHDALVKALRQIASGTTDEDFPLRAMGRAEMAKLAGDALAAVEASEVSDDR